MTAQPYIDAAPEMHEDLSRLLGALALRGPVTDERRIAAAALLAAVAELALLDNGQPVPARFAAEFDLCRSRVRHYTAALGMSTADLHLLAADPRAGAALACLLPSEANATTTH